MGFRLGGTCDAFNGEYLAQVQLECSSIDSRGSVRPFRNGLSKRFPYKQFVLARALQVKIQDSTSPC